MTNHSLNETRELGEFMGSELDQVSGGASGLIYAVIAGAQKGATESRLARHRIGHCNSLYGPESVPLIMQTHEENEK